MRTGSRPPRQPFVHLRRIEALERALKHAQHLLHQDDLTPLLNRRGFRRACDQWSASQSMGTRMCCAMMDLDDFKSINDQYGHPVGDAALIHFAKTLRLHVRRADAIARLGGDEFALVLHNAGGIDTLGVLERLQKILEASPIPAPGGSVRLRFLPPLSSDEGPNKFPRSSRSRKFWAFPGPSSSIAPSAFSASAGVSASPSAGIF